MGLLIILKSQLTVLQNRTCGEVKYSAWDYRLAEVSSCLSYLNVIILCFLPFRIVLHIVNVIFHNCETFRCTFAFFSFLYTSLNCVRKGDNRGEGRGKNLKVFLHHMFGYILNSSKKITFKKLSPI